MSIINGAADGLKLLGGIFTLLIAFLGILALLNLGLGWAGGLLNGLFGWHVRWSLEAFLGYLFYPLTLVLGIPPSDALAVAKVIGERTVTTEVVSYNHLAALISSGALRDPRSAIIASYALCGFAHVASLAIFVGGTGALAPGPPPGPVPARIPGPAGGDAGLPHDRRRGRRRFTRGPLCSSGADGPAPDWDDFAAAERLSLTETPPWTTGTSAGWPSISSFTGRAPRPGGFSDAFRPSSTSSGPNRPISKGSAWETGRSRPSSPAGPSAGPGRKWKKSGGRRILF